MNEPYSTPKEVLAQGGTPDNGPYMEAQLKRGNLLRPQVYKRVRISPVEVYNRVGKSVILVCKKDQKGS